MTQALSIAEIKPDGRAPLSGWDFRPDEPGEEGGRRPAVLILENRDIDRQILKGILKSEGYQLLEARTATEAFALLKREKIDLVILDLMMPEISGLDFCRQIKANHQTRLVPVLILTSIQGAENEIAGIASGADEFLVQPLHHEIVRTRIRSMLHHKAAIDSLEEAESILLALGQAIELRDKTTRGHCQRLAKLSIMLGTALELPRSQIEALHRGGFLHDIGKICVPDAILFKPGALTEAEWVVMRMHTTKGEEICRPTKSLTAVLPIIRSHHERWDGSGYPDGLNGEHIPLLARILQIADIYDALTSVRPYKPAFTSSEALEVLDREARRGWRDRKLVTLFRKMCVTPLPTGAEEPTAPLPPDPVRESLLNMDQALK